MGKSLRMTRPHAQPRTDAQVCLLNGEMAQEKHSFHPYCTAQNSKLKQMPSNKLPLKLKHFSTISNQSNLPHRCQSDPQSFKTYKKLLYPTLTMLLADIAQSTARTVLQ
ncbi:hypothetical protein PoB_005025700 [Plakobranchus ocellatus]|uniref:Uncharacterized protein n=1 Tax=Plakobranchus ocellatus TaxID=259542 RepID=A0AAV4BXA0_9GAST|nr:hypothetical protein PoB_005025700 [Plakobranchus ocellatus]